MIKGAIFDLDGTLLDSMSIWENTGEDYLRSLGKEPKENLKETLKTFSLERSARYFIENYDVSFSIKEIIHGINKMIEDFYISTVTLKNGVYELLKTLNEHNIKMCVATVTDAHLADAALTRLGVRQYFCEIFSGYSKEEPYIYREAQKYLDIPKNQIIVFEDALYALKTADKDNFITAGVYDAYEENQAEIKNIADIYISDYSGYDITKESVWK